MDTADVLDDICGRVNIGRAEIRHQLAGGAVVEISHVAVERGINGTGAGITVFQQCPRLPHGLVIILVRKVEGLQVSLPLLGEKLGPEYPVVAGVFRRYHRHRRTGSHLAEDVGQTAAQRGPQLGRTVRAVIQTAAVIRGVLQDVGVDVKTDRVGYGVLDAVEIAPHVVLSDIQRYVVEIIGTIRAVGVG